ncbi:MAG TPA: GNAT family N-acetyltransferase [Candidatus Limnocylindrales bacterium]|nr:GNAT family N-acetyltransferase [Candidatus Limnocylindrales bacterium]
MTSIREAGPADLTDWDEHVVDVPGGHVYQSRAWAEHRVRAGWQADHLLFDDAFAALVLRRGWPWVGGSSAYVPRGPVAAGDAPEQTAERLAAIVDWLAERDVAVVASDAEIPAASGYPAQLARIAFHPIEEIQPSRHRIALPLEGRSVDDVFAGIAKSTRQRIRKAETEGIVVVRHDGRVAPAGVGEGFVGPKEPSEIALDRFYDLLLETGERRHFSFGPREAFLAWWSSALRAGHLVLLEARSPDGEPQAGLVLYRHGERLSTVHSGDRESARRDHPGALHLLRWRAIQLAIRENRSEMDLGGADVAGARHEPHEGDEMWGLYQHKVSFGGQWLELAGAHERVLDANRYRLGRLAARAARVLGR